MNGRWDLPKYSAFSDAFRNFITNYKGNAIYRPGFELMLKLYDCVLIEFKFNKEQDYLCVFYANNIKFLTYDVGGNFGFVQNGGSDLVVASPYSLAEAKELKGIGTAQNADVMYIVHPSHAPRKLVRTSATNFTLNTYVRTADPFTGAGDYPSKVEFHKGSLYYAATDNKITTIWRSKIGDYDDMTTGTADDDGFEFAVADLTEKITWLMSGNNSLLGGSSQANISINGDEVGKLITPTTVSAIITNTDGANDTQPIRKDNLLFYINSSERNVNYFSYDLLTESFVASDANLLSYDITEGRIKNLQYKKDRNNLIWTLCDGKLLSLNFNKEEKIMGWHKHDSVADFEDIQRMTNNEGDVQLFALQKYGSDYFLTRMAEDIQYPQEFEFCTGDEEVDREMFWRKTAELFKSANHSDLSQFVSNLHSSTITYVGATTVGSTGTITSSAADFSSADVDNWIEYKTDTGAEIGIFKITGYTSTTVVDVEVLTAPTTSVYSSWYKTFNTVGGLTDFIGGEVSVVGNGGYLGEFVVDGAGEIDLGREITVALVGFKYEGLIKTFNIGFAIQGINTQATVKNMNNVGIRFISSAGGKVGTSLYRMEDIQEFDPAGYYDLIPLPMDNDKYVSYNDSFDRNKCLYIKQDKPLPFKITSIIADITYGTRL